MTLQTVGYIGNNAVFDIEIDGGILYAGQGSEVRIYDISTAAKISSLTWRSYVGRIDTGYLVRSLHGFTYPNGKKYLFISTIKSLQIYDVTTYTRPVFTSYTNIVGTIIKDKGQELRDIAIYGNYAYVSVYGGGIVVLDISNIARPVYVRTIPISGYNRPGRITVSGSRLYVGCWTDHRLDVFDIATPNSPTLLGSWSTPIFDTTLTKNNVSSVKVSGNYAYVAEYHYGVHVVDISNPSSMKEVSSAMNINVSDITLLGNYVYVSVRYQGLTILDKSTPTSIKVIGKSAQRTGYYEGIRTNGTYTVLANDTFGFEIFSTSNITGPYYMNYVTTIGGADSVTAKDNMLYIGCHDENIWQIWMSGESLQEYNPIQVHGRYPNIKTQGNYIFGSGDWRPVVILDVSNYAYPRILFDGYAESNATSADGILPDGNVAYVSVYYPGNGLGILDISGLPNAIKYISVTELGAHGAVFAKLGANILLMAANAGVNKGLLVLDVSNKSSPRLLTTIGKGTPYNGVAVMGNTVFTITSSAIYAYDFTNPSSPVLLSSLSYSGTWTAYSLTLDPVNKRAYAAGNQIRSFDISNPRSMVLRDVLGLVYPTRDILWYNNHLYVADYYYGIYSLREF